jgi:alpha-L-fucosidase 2
MTPFRSLACVVVGVLGLALSTSGAELKLWYDKPAARWDEALPIGSGRLGAMIFGGAGQERIQFNEDTLWTGKPHDYVREGAHDHLAEIQQLVFAGKEKEASDLVRNSFLAIRNARRCISRSATSCWR